jgi:hypothetical protein
MNLYGEDKSEENSEISNLKYYGIINPGQGFLPLRVLVTVAKGVSAISWKEKITESPQIS